MKNEQPPQHDAFDDAAAAVVELGNVSQQKFSDTPLDELADGILAGAVHYWLFSRQPCDASPCEDCESIDTAEKRMQLLSTLVQEFAVSSDYYHTINDADVGRA